MRDSAFLQQLQSCQKSNPDSNFFRAEVTIVNSRVVVTKVQITEFSSVKLVSYTIEQGGSQRVVTATEFGQKLLEGNKSLQASELTTLRQFYGITQVDATSAASSNAAKSQQTDVGISAASQKSAE